MQYPLRSNVSNNMRQVIQAFMNGFLVPNNEKRLTISNFLNVGMIDLQNTLTGGVINYDVCIIKSIHHILQQYIIWIDKYVLIWLCSQVIDALAYLIYIKYGKGPKSWICIDCDLTVSCYCYTFTFLHLSLLMNQKTYSMLKIKLRLEPADSHSLHVYENNFKTPKGLLL